MSMRFLALALAVVTSSAAVGATNRPNVVIVMTDDQGYGDLSCHGNPEIQTPNLDALHAGSIRLTDFHVAPMCTPTRGQLLSGRDALDNGAMNVSSGRTMLRRGIPTMANVFASAGYHTGLFGKWHLGDVYPYRAIDRGFDTAVTFPSSHIGSAPDYWCNDYFDDTYEKDGARERLDGYCTDLFFDEAIDWIRARGIAGEPFFAYIPTNAPHAPLWVPDSYREPYRHLPDDIASYFAMIANIDENMGRLESALKNTLIRNDTILIYLTDNGGTAGVRLYNAGMKGGKISLYDGGHRVPCFIRWPAGGLRTPGDIDKTTHCQDLLPTLIELCGLEVPAGTSFDGTSLAPLLRGDQDELPDRMLVVQFSRMNAPAPKEGDAAVLWGRWRLVNNAELYDIKADPGQQDDIAGEHPEIVARMREHYDRWWAEVAPEVNDFSRLSIGVEGQGPTLLTPCDWQDVFLDQQRQVRRGERKNGPWGIVVERPGVYQFELRRWPRESGLALAAPAPAFEGVDGSYPPGVALPIASARLRIGEAEHSKSAEQGAEAVTFRVRLDAGPADLKTWFLDDEGKELCGAYYVEARRIGP